MNYVILELQKQVAYLENEFFDLFDRYGRNEISVLLMLEQAKTLANQIIGLEIGINKLMIHYHVPGIKPHPCRTDADVLRQMIRSWSER